MCCNSNKLEEACVYPGGNVCEPCGGEGEDSRGAETLAGGRLGPHHTTETGVKKNKHTHTPAKHPVTSFLSYTSAQE